jgi:acetyl-CoA acetyltransferase
MSCNVLRSAVVQKLLRKNDLTIDDIDVFEVDEAFASQAVYVQQELGIPNDKLNVNGGAIALGHPLGCTGATLTATALNDARRAQTEPRRHTLRAVFAVSTLRTRKQAASERLACPRLLKATKC